jgi:hypothetical protein
MQCHTEAAVSEGRSRSKVAGARNKPKRRADPPTANINRKRFQKPPKAKARHWYPSEPKAIRSVR